MFILIRTYYLEYKGLNMGSHVYILYRKY